MSCMLLQRARLSAQAHPVARQHCAAPNAWRACTLSSPCGEQLAAGNDFVRSPALFVCASTDDDVCPPETETDPYVAAAREGPGAQSDRRREVRGSRGRARALHR